MNCDKAKGLLNEHIDGLLDEAEKAALHGHAAVCEKCAKELDGLVKAHEAAKYAPRFSAPRGFAARVMAEINRTEKEPGFFKWLSDMPTRFKVAQAAALVVASVMGVYSAGLLSDSLTNGNGPAENSDSNLVASVSIEYLDPVPPESMADMYLSEQENGK